MCNRDIIIDNRIKFINNITSRNITKDTYYEFIKTDEYKELMRLVQTYNELYIELCDEMNLYMESIREYKEHYINELKRYNKIVEFKIEELYESIKDYFSYDIKDELEKYLSDDNDKKLPSGVANGLAYTEYGGDTLQIEVTMYKGEGRLVLTGKLGDVMKESAQAALSYVKANAVKFKIDENLFKENDIHVHVPEGAVPKDGPSAGVTMATAIVSALSHRLAKHTVGMTGEITLRGRVLPIGGLREKSIAAHRSGLKTILIPKENVRDIDEIPEGVKKELEIIPVSIIDEVIENALI